MNVCQNCSYDEMKEIEKSSKKNKPLEIRNPGRGHIRPKIVASSYVSRRYVQKEFKRYLFKVSAKYYNSNKRPGYYLKNAYFLIFLITISTLTIFSIKPVGITTFHRLQVTFTLLLTSVSFKWVKLIF